MAENRGTCSTDAGSWLLWQPEAFSHVVDYETWSREIEDDADLLRHVAAGDAVPITIGQDMAAAFAVRSGTPGSRLRRGNEAILSDRERKYLVASSEPYLLVSKGSARLTGIEQVGWPGDLGLSVPIPVGDWSVTVHLIGWDEEPGSTTADGRPSPDALSDFVVLVNPTAPSRPRTALATFPPPEAAAR